MRNLALSESRRSPVRHASASQKCLCTSVHLAVRAPAEQNNYSESQMCQLHLSIAIRSWMIVSIYLSIYLSISISLSLSSRPTTGSLISLSSLRGAWSFSAKHRAIDTPCAPVSTTGEPPSGARRQRRTRNSGRKRGARTTSTLGQNGLEIWMKVWAACWSLNQESFGCSGFCQILSGGGAALTALGEAREEGSYIHTGRRMDRAESSTQERIRDEMPWVGGIRVNHKGRHLQAIHRR